MKNLFVLISIMASTTSATAKVLSDDVLSICKADGYSSPYNYDRIDTMSINKLKSENSKVTRFINQGTRYDYDKVLFIDKVVALNKHNSKRVKKQPSMDFICNEAFAYVGALEYQTLVSVTLDKKIKAEAKTATKRSTVTKGFSTTAANKFLISAMDSCKSSGMFDGHKSLYKMSKSDIFYQTNTGRFRVSEYSLKMYEGYENSNAKHYEVCKYVASVIGKQKYVLSPNEVQKRKADAAKVRADKKAKQEAAAIAKAEAEAVEKAKAEARQKTLETERARIAPINAEINKLSKELRSIENKTRNVAPRTTSVLVKSKMDNGAIQAVVNGELAAIVDIDGVITKPGYVNLYLVKMKNLYTRKDAGFDIPVTTYGINADPERELREYKASAEGKADVKRTKEIKLKLQELKSQL